MDRSLDEIIGDRPPRGGGGSRPDRRGPPAPRAPRREEYPRDGVRKNRRDEPTNIDTDWVHDRYDEDRNDRRRGGGRGGDAAYDDRGSYDRHAPDEEGTRIRVDNIHYDIAENDIKELFERIGPLVSARMLYDRMDRSQGTAFVTYEDPRDARAAIREYDGANAQGQPIRLTLLPSGPAPPGPASKGSLFERLERPARSLADRMEGGRGGRQDRSYSPEKRGDRRDNLRVPTDGIDRYVPGQRDSRSPIGGPRRGGGRDRGGRRPGARREESDRGGRGGRGGGERPARRGKKTAEELDAEMEDYFGAGGGAANGKVENGSAPATAAPAARDDDIDMVE